MTTTNTAQADYLRFLGIDVPAEDQAPAPVTLAPVIPLPVRTPAQAAPKPAPVDPTPRTGKGIINLPELRSRDRVCHGRTYEGTAEKGAHADILPGQWIRIYGIDSNRYDGPRAFDLTFKVGELAEYKSFNLTYVGKIVSIGEKTITVEDNGRKHRLTVHDFTWRNKDFDLEKISKRNAEWRD